jgi:hypothetical protein
MKKVLFRLAVVSLLVSGVVVAQAQDQPYSGSPKVIRIIREEVKVGKGTVHEVNETAWARAFADAKSPDNWIGMDATSGNNEAWFVSGYDSMSDMDAKTRHALDTMPALKALDTKYSAQDGESVSGTRSAVAVYRDDLSYQGVKSNIGAYRFLYATTVRVRPGHDSEFVEATKISRAAHEKAAVPERWSVFEVTEGMPRGTYLIFQPLKSMADVDAFPQTHGTAYRDAVGDEGRKRLAELNSSATISAETNIFAFNPKMSNPTKEIAAADPGFWTPKPVKKAASTEKKSVGKPGGN